MPEIDLARDSAKLEQRVIVTDDGYELVTHSPFEGCLI